MGFVRSNQMCSRCRNHDVQSILKGHKRICQYIGCMCVRCEETKTRQKYIASEIAYHRKHLKSSGSYSGSDIAKPIFINFVKKSRSTKTETRRNQMCARCKNHGVDNPLKGHKSQCIYADCQCDTCQITSERRKIMAKQIRDYRQTTKHDENVEVILTEDFGDEEQSRIQLPKLTAIKEMEGPLSPPLSTKSSPPPFPDEFYMAQSLYEQFILEHPRKIFQLIYAFVMQSSHNFGLLENSLQDGKFFLKIFTAS